MQRPFIGVCLSEKLLEIMQFFSKVALTCVFRIFGSPTWQFSHYCFPKRKNQRAPFIISKKMMIKLILHLQLYQVI